jgi:hypothetical protein
MGKARNLSKLMSDNIVGTTELADNAVTTAKLANDAVTAAKLDVNGADISYDNSVSGISATTLQAAIDYLNVLSGGGSAGAQATYTREEFNATAGQTTFTTVNGYTLGYLQVFMNGIMLDSGDYTANNESTVVLATGAAASDEVTTIAYDSFAISEVLRVLNISASALNDAVTIAANRRVGLGVSQPLEALHVQDASAASDSQGIRNSTYRPHLTLEDLSTNSSDWQVWADSGDLSFLTGDISASGTNGAKLPTARMKIDASGRVTTPYQPAFRASFFVSPPTAYTAGARVLNFTTVGHNIGAHYDGTNKFTAPVSGLYRFSCDRSLNTYGINQVIRHPSMSFMVNGVATHSVNTAVSVTDAVTASSYTHFVVNMGTELYLNANDYVQVEFSYDNSPSTLYEYAQNYFSGYLLG